MDMTTSASASVSASSSENLLHDLELPSPLLLGSASFTRKLILKEMKVPFVKCVRPIDEKAMGGDRDSPSTCPSELVLTLAHAKMNHLLEQIQTGNCETELQQARELYSSSPTQGKEEQFIVLTGDQVVTWEDKILEKPESTEEAKQFVEGYRISPPSTVGSCVLTHLPSKIQVSGVDTATIYFSPKLPGSDLIDRLLELDEPILSCAGGLMIEHPLTKEHLERIDGTEDSVMGLSKDLVLRLLKELKEKVGEHYQQK